jgi:hypothetical protein
MNIQLNGYYLNASLPRSQYGGKANYLVELKKMGLSVPDALLFDLDQIEASLLQRCPS